MPYSMAQSKDSRFGGIFAIHVLAKATFCTCILICINCTAYYPLLLPFMHLFQHNKVLIPPSFKSFCSSIESKSLNNTYLNRYLVVTLIENISHRIKRSVNIILKSGVLVFI